MRKRYLEVVERYNEYAVEIDISIEFDFDWIILINALVISLEYKNTFPCAYGNLKLFLLLCNLVHEIAIWIKLMLYTEFQSPVFPECGLTIGGQLKARPS